MPRRVKVNMKPHVQVEQNIPEQNAGVDFNTWSIRNWLDDGKWERMNGL